MLVGRRFRGPATKQPKPYSRRYDVEHDLRDLKVTMRLEKIRAGSQEMVRKEILCSVVAYNLVLEFRRQAANVAKLPPRRLEASLACGTRLKSTSCTRLPARGSQWIERYEKALNIASKDKLPKPSQPQLRERRLHPSADRSRPSS